MPKRLRRTRRRALALALLLGPVLAASCSENPSCVFIDGCQGGPPGVLGGLPATLPDDGQTILPGLPVVESTFPTGPQNASTTPIVVVFSESMAPDTIQELVEVAPVDAFSGVPIGALPTSQTLVADGRVLVILPAAPLQPSDYVVRVAEGAELVDLTGQKVSIAAGAQLASFQVGADDPADPEVVTTFPPQGGAAPITTTPIVTVFDRPMDEKTFTDASFSVEVDGAPPPFDPAPAPLTVTVGFVPVEDTRVFLYQSVDGSGPVSLGTSASVELSLSPSVPPGDEIKDTEGNVLPPTTLTFTTQAIEAPLSISILSNPADGIGIANLTPEDPEELALQVDFTGLEPTDAVTVTIFGDSKETEPVLIALGRTKSDLGIAPVTAVSFSLAELELSTAPGTALVADGTVALAFAASRGAQTTAVRLLDVDLAAPGIQDPLLDTLPPTLTELLVPGEGVSTEFRSDQRDVVLAGRASEPVRSAWVDLSPLTDPGVQPVVGSDGDGLFVAAPVPLGLIDDGGPVDYALTVYDTVLNASEPVLGVFTQHGAVGGTAPFAPGDPITVEVVDAVTLAPIESAQVFTHEDAGDGTSFPLLDTDETDADGAASVLSATAPAVGTILTVEAAGYDLFTFHGIAAGRISVPLRPGAPGLAAVTGAVTTTDSLVALTLDGLQLKLDDTRRPPGLLPTFDGLGCDFPFGSPFPSCPFGPEPILADRLGALTFLGGNFLLTEATFSASTVLEVFDLQVPRAPTVGGDADLATIDVPFLLTSPEELPIEADPVTFSSAFVTGLDLGDLAGDPETTGDPFATVEALVPGVPGAPTVGMGLAFDQGGGLWNVRSAYPGAVSPTGFFGASGAVDPDLLLRVELRDGEGNRSGQRPRLSTLDTLPVPSTLFGPAVPTVISPPDLGSTAGASFNVEFENGLFDASLQTGLYVVRLVDAAGRGWDLFVPDPPDGAPAAVHVPDIAAGGGLPLSDGAIACTVEAYSWPTLDLGAFLLSDVAREHDFFAASAPIVFTQP